LAAVFHTNKSNAAGNSKSLYTPALSEPFKISFYALITQHRPTIEKCARKFRNLLRQENEPT